ncbi:MAG TPA: SDR family oxidoreductase [Acetobacteraceae bacterium]|nr:SDR family oxidoreductase [Acetobacteraceae bacterium]
MTQTVVITGASAGIGRATSIAFARRGCRVALLARGEEGLRGAVRDVEAAGGVALAIPTDVADAAAVERAAEQAERELGPIDVWVNGAMANIYGRFLDIEPDEFRRVTEVIYLGQVNGTRAALRRMQPRNRGTIVQIDSVLGHRAVPLQSAYCGSKFAIRGFSGAVRTELMHDHSGVRISVVCFPSINTPHYTWARNKLSRRPSPVPPVYTPEMAARAILYAAEKAPHEVWVSTVTIGGALGNMVIPTLLDWASAFLGYRAEFSSDPPEPDHQDNLFEPVPRDHGASGRFGTYALGHALVVSAGTARIAAAAAGLGLFAALLRRVGRAG